MCTSITTYTEIFYFFACSLYRCIGLLRLRNTRNDDTAIPNSIECYACTLVGVPVFHSTSCDGAHQPQLEASAGSSLVPIQAQHNNKPAPTRVGPNRLLMGPLWRILDPRSKSVQRWNRAIVVARGVALAVDPLFFYGLSLGIGRGGTPCLHVDKGIGAMATVLRTCVDVVHLCHVWVQLRLAYVSRESLVVGCGKLVWDAGAIARHYVRSLEGFWLDTFVILPIPQVVFWFVVPKLIREEQIKPLMTILFVTFLFQFVPKVYHTLSLIKRLQKVTGYIFGTIWWGFGLNLIAYFIASHVTGGCWYVLAIQRVVSCFLQQCERSGKCNLTMSCSEGACHRFLFPTATLQNPCGDNSTIGKPLCADGDGPFNFGIYRDALPVFASNSLATRILYPIYWGLLNLSSLANELEPSSQLVELIFGICIVLAGLMLFTLLIGNIQVFLHLAIARKRKLLLRNRDMEWWMRRRQLPYNLRQRVRHFEHRSWSAMGGEEEMQLIQDLPEGLRRDIKRYLCIDLVKKVPLFDNLEDLILDNICDRVQPLFFCKGEKIIREGDPVQRMIFIVRGCVKRSQGLSKGMVATSMLQAGGFLGDELLSWCLRRPFIDRLPGSSATFICFESIEAFGLDADHLKFITDHYRYKFANQRLKQTARYYSSNWRTWGAVVIQFGWSRYRIRTRGSVIPVRENVGSSESRLRQYAAMFLSLRPHDHLEI